MQLAVLPSGNYRTWCGDCQQLTVASTRHDAEAASCACFTPPSYDYLHELVCLACERRIGDVALPTPNGVLPLIAYPRCRACGGAAIRSGHVTRRKLGAEPRFPAPRKGRPPSRTSD